MAFLGMNLGNETFDTVTCQCRASVTVNILLSDFKQDEEPVISAVYFLQLRDGHEGAGFFRVSERKFHPERQYDTLQNIVSRTL